jgi:cation diffusion facilitator family transporter
MQREKTIIKTSIFGILANTILIIIKAIIGFIAGSISIVVDAVNNLTDALSSIITIVGTKLAGKRPDKEHPFGHGRIEYITATFIGIIILLAGGVAIYKAITDLIYSIKTNIVAQYSILSLIIIGIAIIIKGIIVLVYKINGKKTNSESLMASATDAIMDVVLSLSTLVAAIITYIFSPKISIEAILGIIIGIFIIKAGIQILKKSMSIIIGERTSPELVKGIKNLILEHKEILGVYDLILNSYGEGKMIGSAHVEVDQDMRAHEIHIITKHIQEDIYNKYGIILTLGIYAREPLSSDIRCDLNTIIKKYSEILELHGFFVDEVKMIVSFDLVIDFSCLKPNDIINKVIEDIKKLHPTYQYNVLLDADIT